MEPKFAILLILTALIAPILGQYPVGQIINTANIEIQGSYSSIDSIFEEMPSIEQVEGSILNGDILILTKLNQGLVMQRNDPYCSSRARYLDQLVGLIRSSIWLKQKQLIKLQTNIKLAKRDIESLRIEVKALEAEILSLNLDEKRKQLSDLLSQLEAKYDIYNNVSDQLLRLQHEYGNSSLQIENLMEVNTQQRAVANAKKTQLEGLDQEIQQLQKKLISLKKKRTDVITELKNALAIVNKSQSQLEQLQVKVRLSESEITQLRVKRNYLADEAHALEVQVGKLKAKASEEEKFEQQIFARLNRKQQQLFMVEIIVGKEWYMQDLKSNIIGLQNILPNFISQNYETYGECFLMRRLTVEKLTNYFTIPGNLLFSYLEGIYGRNIGLPSQSLRINLQFELMDLFSEEWVKEFGVAFNITDHIENTLDFKDDNTCKGNALNLNSGNGIVKSIRGKKIEVNSYMHGQIELNLGACTRFEANNASPSVNQTVYFKGAQKGKNWQAYAISMY